MNVTNKQIAEVFIQAKKLLAKDHNSLANHNFDLNEYICLAINDISQGYTDRQKAAKKIITDRLGLNEWGGPHDVETYVRDVLHAPMVLLTINNLQAYRHRWLDSLIAEFSK